MKALAAGVILGLGLGTIVGVITSDKYLSEPVESKSKSCFMTTRDLKLVKDLQPSIIVPKGTGVWCPQPIIFELNPEKFVIAYFEHIKEADGSNLPTLQLHPGTGIIEDLASGNTIKADKVDDRKSVPDVQAPTIEIKEPDSQEPKTRKRNPNPQDLQ